MSVCLCVCECVCVCVLLLDYAHNWFWWSQFDLFDRHAPNGYWIQFVSLRSFAVVFEFTDNVSVWWRAALWLGPIRYQRRIHHPVEGIGGFDTSDGAWNAAKRCHQSTVWTKSGRLPSYKIVYEEGCRQWDHYGTECWTIDWKSHLEGKRTRRERNKSNVFDTCRHREKVGNVIAVVIPRMVIIYRLFVIIGEKKWTHRRRRAMKVRRHRPIRRYFPAFLLRWGQFFCRRASTTAPSKFNRCLLIHELRQRFLFFIYLFFFLTLFSRWRASF